MAYVEIMTVTCASCGKAMQLIEEGYQHNTEQAFLRFDCREPDFFRPGDYCGARRDGKSKTTILVKKPMRSLTNEEIDETIIKTAELAEVLRESPDMPKAALLNRVAGLLKVATRRGGK